MDRALVVERGSRLRCGRPDRYEEGAALLALRSFVRNDLRREAVSAEDPLPALELMWRITRQQLDRTPGSMFTDDFLTDASDVTLVLLARTLPENTWARIAALVDVDAAASYRAWVRWRRSILIRAVASGGDVPPVSAGPDMFAIDRHPVRDWISENLRWARERDACAGVRGFDALLRGLEREPSPWLASEHAQEEVRGLSWQWYPRASIATGLDGGMCLAMFCAAERTRRFAVVAVHLRRVKLTTGRYPDELDAKLPLDPYVRAPFGYAREGEGFVLKSAGNKFSDFGPTLRVER